MSMLPIIGAQRTGNGRNAAMRAASCTPARQVC
jgi:hypothetical protein